MALEDIAKLISPRRPEIALKILRCFSPDNDGITKGRLLHETGLKPKTLDYYMGIFRGWHLLKSKRRRGAPCIYFLTPSAFHSKLDTLFYDPIKKIEGWLPWT